MTDSHIQPAGQAPAGLADHKAELTMARRVDGRFESAARNAAFAAQIVAYAVLAIVGAWLRTRLIPGGWQIAAACALVAILAWACPLLGWAFGRKQPGWVTSAEICERALDDRIPAQVMEVVSQLISMIRSRGGRRWHGVHVYLSRCTSTEPPDAGVCQTAGVVPVSGRLVVVIGEHLAAGEPMVTRAVLGHESQQVRPVRMYLAWLLGLSRLAGWVVIGWAVPWPVLLLALLAFHVTVTLLSWALEVSCDMGGATQAGVDAMLAALDHLSETVAQIRKDRSGWERYSRAALRWAAGPSHPPLPVRRALIRLRWPQAGSR
jgi:hypothetical protein